MDESNPLLIRAKSVLKLVDSKDDYTLTLTYLKGAPLRHVWDYLTALLIIGGEDADSLKAHVDLNEKGDDPCYGSHSRHNK